MKALLVLIITLLAAATAYAYGRSDTEAMTTMFEGTAAVVTTEPVLLLLSGGLLLVVAGAVRRLPV